MSRVYNFSAGPAVLPEEVLQEAAGRDAGIQGQWNVSHGDEPPVKGFSESSLMKRRQICGNWYIFRNTIRCSSCRAGASQQFAMIPMNLMKNRVADYIVTGQWAKKAYQEAQIYGKANRCIRLLRQDLLLYSGLLRPARIRGCRLRVHL